AGVCSSDLPFADAVTQTCDSATLGADAECTIGFTFAPTVLGAASGEVTITINGIEYHVDLDGTGVGVTVPAALDFGQSGVNDAAKPVSLTITNDQDF